MFQRLLSGLALAAAFVSSAVAQDLPKSQFKVLGLNSPTPVSIHDELPFWRKTIPDAWISLQLTEGKNRQVRRMTAAVGLPTLRLIRARIGQLELASLKLQPGQWRVLDPQEIRAATA